MRRFILAGLILIVIVASGLGAWYYLNKPLYEPGMVRAGQNLRASLSPPMQTGDSQFWQVEKDILLYHFATGQGRNVLVIHGGPGYPYMQPWAGLEPLTKEYRFVYYDQRGCGQSTRPFETFSSKNYYENMTALDRTLGIGAQIADIERIRRILGEQKLILVGHSFGGFLASLYAAEFPDNVEALILVSPAETLVMPPPSGGLFAQVRQRLPPSRLEEYDAYMKRYLDFQSLFSQSEAGLAAMNDEFGQYYFEVMPSARTVPEGKAGGWMVQAMYLSMGQQHDYRAALRAARAPVLVMHGSNDLQPESASRMYADAYPNARFEVIGNATHFSFAEQPGVFATVVSQFLDGLKER